MKEPKRDQQPEVWTDARQHRTNEGDQQRRNHNCSSTPGVGQIAPDVRAGDDSSKANGAQYALLGAGEVHLAFGRRQHKANGQRFDYGRGHNYAAHHDQVHIEFAELCKKDFEDSKCEIIGKTIK